MPLFQHQLSEYEAVHGAPVGSRIDAEDAVPDHVDEVYALQIDVEVRKDQLVFDEMPDDAGHLVAIHLDDGILDLDLRYAQYVLGIDPNNKSAMLYVRMANEANGPKPGSALPR